MGTDACGSMRDASDMQKWYREDDILSLVLFNVLFSFHLSSCSIQDSKDYRAVMRVM